MNEYFIHDEHSDACVCHDLQWLELRINHSDWKKGVAVRIRSRPKRTTPTRGIVGGLGVGKECELRENELGLYVTVPMLFIFIYFHWQVVFSSKEQSYLVKQRVKSTTFLYLYNSFFFSTNRKNKWSWNIKRYAGQLACYNAGELLM